MHSEPRSDRSVRRSPTDGPVLQLPLEGSGVQRFPSRADAHDHLADADPDDGNRYRPSRVVDPPGDYWVLAALPYDWRTQTDPICLLLGPDGVQLPGRAQRIRRRPDSMPGLPWTFHRWTPQRLPSLTVTHAAQVLAHLLCGTEGSFEIGAVMQCAEADALADVVGRAAGELARQWILHAHGTHDEPCDDHFGWPRPPDLPPGWHTTGAPRIVLDARTPPAADRDVDR